jgi:hemerythrin
VDCLNELDVAHHEKNREVISEVLMGLVDYTETHFVFEEALMEELGYPLSDSHKKVHASFAMHINKLVEQHEEGREVTRRLMSDLQIWLTRHIKLDDKDYALFAKKNSWKNKSWFHAIVARFFR